MNHSEVRPSIHPTAFVADGAVVCGDVTLAEDVNIWFNAVLRADSDAIVVGAGTNIQDGCIVHEDRGRPVKIGSNVTVGHGAVLHGCTVGDGTLVGMGAIVLNGAVVGSGCIIGAGALVTQGATIPDGGLALGSPAHVVRTVTKEEQEHAIARARRYVEEARAYRARQTASEHD